jgi:RimJ/RimL family protein N-acetyltransferase
MALINKDPKVMEFMPGVLTEQETKASVQKMDAEFDEHGFGRFACELKETGELIGYVGLSVPTDKLAFAPCAEISWRLGSHYWGHGYATEAAQAVLYEAFTQYNLPEVFSWTVPANTRSIRVMEKLGMTHDRKNDFNHPRLPADHPLNFHVVYRITKAQWESLQDAAH